MQKLTVQARLLPEEREKIRELVKKDGRSESVVLRELILRGLRETERKR